MTGKEMTDEGAEVHLEVWIENQREMVITPGSAVVFLPSRERGPIQLPEPLGNDPVQMLLHEIEELKIKNEGA